MHKLQQLLVCLTSKHRSLLAAIARQARKYLFGATTQVDRKACTTDKRHIIAPRSQASTRSNNTTKTLGNKSLDNTPLGPAKILLAFVVEDVGDGSTLALLYEFVGVDKTYAKLARQAPT